VEDVVNSLSKFGPGWTLVSILLMFIGACLVGGVKAASGLFYYIFDTQVDPITGKPKGLLLIITTYLFDSTINPTTGKPVGMLVPFVKSHLNHLADIQTVLERVIELMNALTTMLRTQNSINMISAESSSKIDLILEAVEPIKHDKVFDVLLAVAKEVAPTVYEKHKDRIAGTDGPKRRSHGKGNGGV